MTQPEISVVMSIYNGAGHLRESVESILSQEGVNFEFIIVNDGSADKSGWILDEYAQRDKRVRVVHQENAGLTKALIKGCSEARGEYIARQDVGDISLPGRLEKQKAALDADETLSFVSCWTEYCGPEWEYLYMVKGTGIATSPSIILSEKEIRGVLDGPTSHPSVMFRKQSYFKAGGYRPQFYFGQDWDLWYRLAEVGKFQMIERMLYRARIMPWCISSLNKLKQEALATLSLEAFLNRRNGLSEDGVLGRAGLIRPEVRKRRARQQAAGFYFIGECLRRNGDKRAMRYLIKSININPFLLKAWVRLLQSLVFVPHKT